MSIQRIAFFDMDLTVLKINSAALWMKYLYTTGEIKFRKFAQIVYYLLLYKFGVLEVEAVVRKNVAGYKGNNEKEFVQKIQIFFQNSIKHQIAETAKETIKKHQSQGDYLILLTSSFPYLANILGEFLKFDQVICTELEVINNEFTGKVTEPPCLGKGKVQKVEIWAKKHQKVLTETFFYTDSYNDLPMLQYVKYPIVVNPDVRLKRLARTKNWPIQHWY